MSAHLFGNPACGPAAGGVSCLSLPALWPANHSNACCSRRTFPAHAGERGDPLRAAQIGDIECDECFCEATAPSAASELHSSAALAVLMLGHRQRLVFSSIPGHVIAPSVRRGYAVTFFAILEAGPMRRPWALPGAIIVNPLHGSLMQRRRPYRQTRHLCARRWRHCRQHRHWHSRAGRAGRLDPRAAHRVGTAAHVQLPSRSGGHCGRVPAQGAARLRSPRALRARRAHAPPAG